MIKDYDLKKGIKPVYPVILDFQGNVIDGRHRLESDPDWPTQKLDWVKTEHDRVLVRHVLNCARRSVSVAERQEEMKSLAESMKKEGVELGEIIPRIAELTPFTYRYVAMLLPDEFKREYKKQVAKSELPEEKKSEIISQLEAPPKPESVECDLQNKLADLVAGIETQHSYEANCSECRIAEKCARIKEFIGEVLA